MGSARGVGLFIGCFTLLLVGCSSPLSSQATSEQESVTLTRTASWRSAARETDATPARSVQPPAITVESRPSVLYLDRLAECVDRGRAQMPQITASAEVAASRVTRGARLFAFGAQKEFLNETIDRAGGLAMLAPVPKVLNRGDVILYAVPSKMTVADRIRIADWRGKGVYVVAFASAMLSADRYFQPDVLIDTGDTEGLTVGDPAEKKICPTDTVANIVNVWTWTGEFVAACTRLGRLPVLNQGLGEDGSRDRAARLRGKTFHEDVRVPAIAAGLLGGCYLDSVAESIAAVRKQAPPTLEFGGRWLREARQETRGLYVASNLFPAHFEDPRAPQPFARRSDLKVRQAPQTPVSVVIGYQDPPQIAIDYATLRRGRLIYTSARRDSADGRQEVLYVNPHTPADDACVAIPGYDITVLPSSSVMQAAVYWSLVAETAGIPPKRAAMPPAQE